MSAVRRKRRDLFQNLSIVLLSLSAVVLFTQTQLDTLADGRGGYWDRLMGSPSASAGPAADPGLAGLAAPVRVAVSNAFGRYGDISLTTQDFSAAGSQNNLGSLLKEALGTAQPSAVCTEADFLAALDRTSVYYDFWEPLPLSVLAGLVGGDLEDGGAEARRLAVSAEDDGSVRLYLWDGESRYTRCAVAVSAASLSEVVNAYELGNAFFAFDAAEEIGPPPVEPCSFFLRTQPDLPVLSAAPSLSDARALLSALGFNPDTKSRYTESGGTEVIMDGDRTLRIRTDGDVLYTSGGEPTLTVKADGEVPTAQEAAAGAGALLSGLAGELMGDASFYLKSLTRTGNATVLQFGCQVSGVPIRLSGADCAAEVTLTDAAVSSLSLRFRQYAATDGSSLLLPLRQALAIAAGDPGRELCVGYADSGSSTVSAAWLLE